MLTNNLAVLLAKSKKKISDCSKATGISRTTLTALYYNKEKGITYETLEKLVSYFDIEVEDFWLKEKTAHHGNGETVSGAIK